MEIISEAHKNKISLCIFKSTEILDFEVEKTNREWNKIILNQVENENNQLPLFSELKKEIKLIRKIPYKFFYKFKYIKGKISRLMIED